ncbi:MAG TPA: cytochrome d ubiquinol oxidase subunit II [Nitrospiraceae bacterium]|nr:cytochrome d ubiquinol oxidase subunit II [Nitrospiraceae bacterium]
MTSDLFLAGMLLVSLILYVLTGGADYGAGVWSLLARGSKGRAHRALIDRAIAPIWEANHVWLILVVTILFAGFPLAYAAISTTLHLPLTALLVGIVLRGSAFVFRTHDAKPVSERDASQVFWSWIFAGSSILAPLMLGTTIGAIASGRLTHRPATFFDSFVAPWLAAFPLLVGCFALALFTYLAAIYLIFESRDRTLQDDFRRRALWCWFLVSAIGLVVLYRSRAGAPEIYDGLMSTTGGRLTLALTTVAGLVSLAGLFRRWFPLARAAAAAQVALIILGWSASQYPYVIPPDITLAEAAAPESTLRLLIWSLVFGGLVLFPSLYYLYKIFKPHALFESPVPEQANCPPSDILSDKSGPPEHERQG